MIIGLAHLSIAFAARPVQTELPEATPSVSVCGTRTSIVDLKENLHEAQAAFEELDSHKFFGALSRAERDLPCINERLTPEDVKLWHQIQGLKAYFAKDESGTIGHFQAVVAIDPEAQLDDSIAPVGHPLQQQFAKAFTTPLSLEKSLQLKPGIEARIDGSVRTTAPTQRPFVIQGIQQNHPFDTQAISSGGSLPEWARQEIVAASPVTPRKRRRGAPWLIAGGTVAIGSVGSYAYAWTQRQTYFDATTSSDARPQLRLRTNVSTAIAGGLGGVALGLATAGVVLSW